MEKINVIEVFKSIQGEGNECGVITTFIRLGGCSFRCSFCFTENTKIQTPTGHVRIADLKVGDKVLAYNGHEIVEDTVVTNYKRWVQKEDMVKIVLDNNHKKPIFCTKEHPFFIKGQWVQAKDIKPGDEIYSMNYSKWRMKNKNPMQNEQIKQKAIQTCIDKGHYEEASKRLKQKWQEEEFRNLNIERMTNDNPMWRDDVLAKNAKSHNYKKSGPEKTFETICELLKLDVSHNNELTIGRYLPDFVVNGQNKVIEVYDSSFMFYKLPDGTIGKRDSEWEFYKWEYYTQRGYDCICIDINQIHDEHYIQNLVDFVYSDKQEFHNGTKVVSVQVPTDRQMAAVSGDKTGCYVYNVETNDTHTFFAQCLLVHNCDSKQTWEPGKNGEMLTVDETVTRIEEMATNHVTITGGNPAIWKEPMEQLLIQLKIKGYKISMETQGDIYRDWMCLVDNLVISPKNIPNLPITVDEYKRNIQKIITMRSQGQNLGLVTIIKTPIFTQKDLDWFKEFVDFKGEYKIYLSVGNDWVYMEDETEFRKLILQRYKWLIETVIEDKWFCDRHASVLPQIHTLVWTNISGV